MDPSNKKTTLTDRRNSRKQIAIPYPSAVLGRRHLLSLKSANIRTKPLSDESRHLWGFEETIEKFNGIARGFFVDQIDFHPLENPPRRILRNPQLQARIHEREAVVSSQALIAPFGLKQRNTFLLHINPPPADELKLE
jgi:hypothetical protein